MNQPFIVVGDTTTHGGTICQGIYSHTIDRAPMVVTGHKFNCPACGVEATLIGSSHVTVNGQRRVLQGDKTTCGAKVLSRYKTSVSETGAST
ncbi:Zn-binding Pro-Ala-Ala-Arg (PAAR) domain-containing protein, incolved in TypeVI secretion [Kosakonia arachidis]|uniref:Zn-binding Pro-Ala-Ala-Arg (PAAR) domain-containing protein, incolved in TypeVI secretion n=1 Tax=Kosakonia arachidis TaxID=551989 RepID=A0A1I6Y6G2_9ENTR|nr:Zn-binding Pro-Ala-Ala-Arg (PAAR) domain-containing protein, incolved in TypeVI secretion [Kosakonia arachidis]